MLPVMKKTPSGDHARSYISEVLDLHIVLTRHVSLSSSPSSKLCVVWFSAGTQSRTLPSSPAVASISPGNVSSYPNSSSMMYIPRGHHLTTLTACVCLTRVDRYVTFRSSPLFSTFQSWVYVSIFQNASVGIFHTRTLLSPPAVASRPLPWGSKWAEYMGAFSLCHDTSSGAAFIVPGAMAHPPFVWDMRSTEVRIWFLGCSVRMRAGAIGRSKPSGALLGRVRRGEPSGYDVTAQAETFRRFWARCI
jgi:hypothetical protein